MTSTQAGFEGARRLREGRQERQPAASRGERRRRRASVPGARRRRLKPPPTSPRSTAANRGGDAVGHEEHEAVRYFRARSALKMTAILWRIVSAVKYRVRL